MGKSNIQWCDKVWNVVTGCSHAGSPGCDQCYAKRMSKRLAGRYGYPKDVPFKVTLHPDRLDEPFHWKKPCKIFVCSMGDLFHEDIDFARINDIYSIMRRSERHTFMVLTKRILRAQEYFSSPLGYRHRTYAPIPDNVYLGVTAENQRIADERIPILLQIPATKRFVSIEPMLGSINIAESLNGFEHGNWHQKLPSLDWVICGCESGPKRRPCKVEWIHSLQQQCSYAHVPFFLKQMDIDGKLVKMPELDGKVWKEYPNE